MMIREAIPVVRDKKQMTPAQVTRICSNVISQRQFIADDIQIIRRISDVDGSLGAGKIIKISK